MGVVLGDHQVRANHARTDDLADRKGSQDGAVVVRLDGHRAGPDHRHAAPEQRADRVAVKPVLVEVDGALAVAGVDRSGQQAVAHAQHVQAHPVHVDGLYRQPVRHRAGQDEPVAGDIHQRRALAKADRHGLVLGQARPVGGGQAALEGDRVIRAVCQSPEAEQPVRRPYGRTNGWRDRQVIAVMCLGMLDPTWH